MDTKQKKKVRFIYREQPKRDEDSGWRIFSGNEDQSYTDNPDNTGIYDSTTILKIDPSITDLFLSPVGSVFERENDKYNIRTFRSVRFLYSDNKMFMPRRSNV